jgi:hypothetical protein
MAFFSLTDITFNSNKNSKVGGPLRALESSVYESNTFRYPIDLGSYDKGHYMVIHINEQRATQFKGTTTSDQPTVISQRTALQSARGATNIGGSAASILGVASDLISKAEKTGVGSAISGFLENKVVSGISSVLGNGNGANAFKELIGSSQQFANEIKSIVAGISSTSFTRTIQRTTDTIALYMPDTLNYVYNQEYSTPKIGDAAVGALSAGASAIDAYKSSPDGEKGKNIVKNLTPFAAAALAKSKGDLGKVLFAAGTGLAMNPMMEMIYASPKFRTFNFSFLFYPRDEKEAAEVQNILERLRFHQAPEIKSNSGGFFLVPPSEFDIKFYYNGGENPNIPPITTCVLKSIDIDYAPDGWSAYESPADFGKPKLGRTGMPVAIRLVLGFEETEIMTKDSYKRPSSTNSNIGA